MNTLQDGQRHIFARDRLATSDGSWIAYHQSGEGPAIVVLHGLMEAAHSHSELIGLIAKQFRVIAPDRRGRGASGPSGEGDPLDQEVSDLEALMAHVGAKAVLGVSAGAIIALEAAARNPSIEAVAVFDPPLSVRGSAPTGWLGRFQYDMAREDRIDALVTAMLGTRMGPPVLRLLPRLLLAALTRRLAASDGRSAPPGASMIELAYRQDRIGDFPAAERRPRRRLWQRS